jgi:8-oxo-dGTP diphosphatase
MDVQQTESVICTVDVVLMTVRGGALHVALLQRDHWPYQGSWALPGGYVHTSEDCDAMDAARRVLKDKAKIESPYLEQLATFSGPNRDPRGWSISVAYYALVESSMLESAPSNLRVTPVDQARVLPFDHEKILATAIERIRNKSAYSSLPAHLCPQAFTLPQLQSVYESVLGERINPVSFRRKVKELDMAEEIPGEFVTGGSHRPAQLYRLKARFKKSLSLTDRGLNSG